MTSREFQEVMAAIPPDFASPEADYLAVRAMMAPFHGHPVPSTVRIEISSLGGIRVGWCEDLEHLNPGRIVFHCHGGGLVSCPLDDYMFYGAMLAQQLGSLVVMPDYRLAPEHRFPWAHDDCLSAYRGLLASGVDPSRVVVSGDSCGGGLGLAVLMAARDEGLPAPAGFVALSGWFDLAVEVPTTPNTDDDPFLTAQWVRNRGLDYTGGAVPLDDPKVSPAYASFEGLPPMYLPVGQFDTLREGVFTTGRTAMRAGVAVTIESWPGMVHGWHGLVSAGVPEAIDAFLRVRRFVDEVAPPGAGDAASSRGPTV